MAAAATPLPQSEHEALARIVGQFGLSDVLLDLAATTERVAIESKDLIAIERRGDVARKLLTAAVSAERLRL